MKLTKFRTTRLSPALGARLKRFARDNELAESAVIRLALQRFLPRYGKDRDAADDPVIREGMVGTQHTQSEERSAL